MAYIFKQKLQISDLADLKQTQKKVLLYQPEEYLGLLYGHYLKLHNFDVKHCPALDTIKAQATAFLPHVLIFNIHGQDANRELSWLGGFKKEFPSVYVVTVGMNIDAGSLKKLLDIGVSSHVNRRHSRPQDIAILTKALFH